MTDEIMQLDQAVPDDVERRELLRRMGAILGTAVVGATVFKASEAVAQAATGTKRKYRYGMVIDLKRCVGCDGCVLACKTENRTPPGVSYTVVTEDIPPGSIDDKPLFMTKPCFQCEEPPCVPVCPVSATFKRHEDGIVVVDYDRCIGCRYCMTACPYGARWFDFGEEYPAGPFNDLPSPELNQYRKHEEGKSPIGNVRKCTFCLHLQDDKGKYDRKAGRWPACAKTCPGHAIHFGDFNDPKSDLNVLLRERNSIRLKEELGTEPNVFYLL